MTVNTSQYREAHGRNPRPSQHGLWMFQIERRGAYTLFQTTAAYRDAIREAKAEAKMIGGATEIIVEG
jgi:hypothetical protein